MGGRRCASHAVLKVYTHECCIRSFIIWWIFLYFWQKYQTFPCSRHQNMTIWEQTNFVCFVYCFCYLFVFYNPFSQVINSKCIHFFYSAAYWSLFNFNINIYLYLIYCHQSTEHLKIFANYVYKWWDSLLSGYAVLFRGETMIVFSKETPICMFKHFKCEDLVLFFLLLSYMIVNWTNLTFCTVLHWLCTVGKLFGEFTFCSGKKLWAILHQFANLDQIFITRTNCDYHSFSPLIIFIYFSSAPLYIIWYTRLLPFRG